MSSHRIEDIGMAGSPPHPDTGITDQGPGQHTGWPHWGTPAIVIIGIALLAVMVILQGTLGLYLPMNAGDTIYTLRPEAHALLPWAGFGAFCLYAAAALAAGFVLIRRRDA